MSKTIKEMLQAMARAARGFDSGEVNRLSKDMAQHIDDNIATNPKGFVKVLQISVDSFDRMSVELLCDKLIVHLRSRSRPYPLTESKKILSCLRRKRYFDLIIKVSDVFIHTNRDDSNIRRQHAQALLDSGYLSAGLDVLTNLQRDCEENKDQQELDEAIGLLGRGYKQLYMDAYTQKRPGLLIRRHLNHAIENYFKVYSKNAKKTWHGVNAAALIARAKRDKIPLDKKLPDPAALGQKILKTIASSKNINLWDCASAAEACLALQDYPQALKWIIKYTEPDNTADAFEFASTLRQFEEVWQLNDKVKEQGRILHLLRSSLLRSEGGRVEFNNPSQNVASIESLKGDKQYEQILGKDRYKSFQWYLDGLDRAAGVAQICDLSGNGFGTGFVLQGKDVHASLSDRWVLITNAHVVSNETAEQGGRPGALPTDEVLVRFEASGSAETFEVERVLFSSQRSDLDCTILGLGSAFQNVTSIKPFDIAKRLPLSGKNQRVYIVGYPAGGKLSFSIDDNLLLDHEVPKVHYRTPTEGGSSGSPVFNQNWSLIALHHAGGFNMKKLNGRAGTYDANEGLCIQTILKAVAAELD